MTKPGDRLKLPTRRKWALARSVKSTGSELLGVDGAPLQFFFS
jgi:hypothetical protein